MRSISKKKIFVLIATCLFTVLLFGLFNNYYNDQSKKIDVSFEVNSDKVEEFQVYYDLDGNKEWIEENSVKQVYTKVGAFKKLEFKVPSEAKNIRIDMGSSPANLKIQDLKFKKIKEHNISLEELNRLKGQVNDIVLEDGEDLQLQTLSNDPYIELNNVGDILMSVGEKPQWLNWLMGIVALILGFIFANSLKELKNSIKLVKISFENRKLIKSLSQNDFKNKFASSYLGVIWGFVSPLVTIAVYWFVFQVALGNGDVGNVPYILWFVAGIIPWFFFLEALPSTTNVFLEYSYLVKKVVFKIEVLPAIRIIAALFVHAFFIVFIYVISSIYGRLPDVYTLQFIYYSLCMIVLVFALSLITSSVVLFFRDLSQIIGIILNVGFWITPIAWQTNILPEFVAKILKLNPMYYVVTGYRDSFIDKIFIWQRPYEAIYFWAFCLVVLLIGTKIFNRLKPHFSDVI